MPVLSYRAELHEMLMHMEPLLAGQKLSLKRAIRAPCWQQSSHTFPSHPLGIPDLRVQYQYAAGRAPSTGRVPPAPSRATGAHTDTRAGVLPPRSAPTQLSLDGC